MKNIKHINNIILILVVSSLLLIIFLPNAPGQTTENITSPIIPNVYIELLEQNKTANVAPGDTGVVTFSGKVTVDMNPVTRVVVSLMAEDTWGSAVVEPSTLLFASNGEQPFSVSVRAPKEASCNTVGEVRVTGRWRMYPGTLGGPCEPNEGVVGIINIAQYCRFSTSTDSSNIEITAGSDAKFTLNIHNEGNGLDSFNIEICNIEELESKGINVRINQILLELAEKQNGSVEISISVPDDMDCGKHDLDVIISSQLVAESSAQPIQMSFKLNISESPMRSIYFWLLIIGAVTGVICGFVFWRWRKYNRIKNIEYDQL
jgi:hypothetical protein